MKRNKRLVCISNIKLFLELLCMYERNIPYFIRLPITVACIRENGDGTGQRGTATSLHVAPKWVSASDHS